MNQVFVPTVAEFPDDIAKSLEIQKPLVDAGYRPGLMVVIRPVHGRAGVTLDSLVKKQYRNLKKFKKSYGDAPVVVMLPNLPIDDLDFLAKPAYASEFVKRGVDFAKELPIGGVRILSHHLNCLCTKEQFADKSEEQWKNAFHRKVSPALRGIASYAKNKGVDVKVENYPVPPFGDIRSDSKREYKGVSLNELRDPHYLTSIWGFEQVRDTGYGLVVDLSHSRTPYRNASLRDPENTLYETDVDKLASKTVFDEVLALQSDDLVHLNDGKDVFSEAHGQKKETVFRESMALGKGDIAEMPYIIAQLDVRRIPYVLEIEESTKNLRANRRPNTNASIRYLLS